MSANKLFTSRPFGPQIWEMDKFTETYNLPNMNHEETENLKSLILSRFHQYSKPPNKGNSRTRWDHRWIITDIERRITLILLKHCHIIEEKETLSNSFYKASISLTPKPDKGNTRKENYRLISLVNMEAKILNKLLTNQIYQHTMIKWDLSLGCKAGQHVQINKGIKSH